MTLRERLPYRKLALLLALAAFMVLVWWLASRPILFHSRFLATAEDRSCRDYTEGEAGIPILNPLRSRSPERAADAFLRAASNGTCLPDWSERECKYVAEHQIPAQSWRLVNRWDTARHVLLVYQLYAREPTKRTRSGCSLFYVELQRTGATWEISAFGSGGLHDRRF
jgi:hypothetical protein